MNEKKINHIILYYLINFRKEKSIIFDIYTQDKTIIHPWLALCEMCFGEGENIESVRDTLEAENLIRILETEIVDPFYIA